ncbi:hypothetical protein RUM44_001491 [Polyplax serrata]|uniref:Uncharacterized protein n=1 Tax=Polyplax serrata TaxID=468196 RepID=A0ABR1ALP0_POLSC
MTWAFHRFWLILHFLLVIVNVTESRYLKNEETANQLSQHSMNALDEDIDLETVVEDYYDDLWQYLETFGDKSKKKFNEEKKKGKEELGQPNFADYDYMSDMAVAPEPIKDEKTHKVTTEKENGSHGNEQPVNGSQIDLNVLRANRESSACLTGYHQDALAHDRIQTGVQAEPSRSGEHHENLTNSGLTRKNLMKVWFRGADVGPAGGRKEKITQQYIART